MRFLHVSHQYPPAIGGSERYIADLSEEMVRRGHQVDVFTSRALDFHTWANELPPFQQVNGVNVFRFSSMRRRRFVWKMLHYGLRHYWRTRARRFEPLILLGGGPISLGMLRALLARGRRYDLIHLNCLVYSHVAYGYWAARLLDVPVVVTPHAHAGQEVTYDIGYQRDVMFGCDHVIADTPAERNLLLQLGLDPWRISTGGIGLDPQLYQGPNNDPREQLGLPGDSFVMLFLGRKSAYKGLKTALDAYRAIRTQHPYACFLAVGPETDYSRALWPHYEDLPGLHILGAVSNERKLDALAASDCLVLPSTGEAFGIVLLEAWILGRPVIGAKTLAMSSVISDGHDGLLAAPGDSDELAACVGHLAANSELARRMGANGREKVLRRHTVERVASRIEGIYWRVLRRRRRVEEAGT